LNKVQASFISLLKTKVKEDNIERIATVMLLGWKWITKVSCTPQVRVWVAWKLRICVLEEMNMIEQLVHCKEIQVSTNKQLYTPFVNESSRDEARQPLWNDLKLLAKNMSMP